MVCMECERIFMEKKNSKGTLDTEYLGNRLKPIAHIGYSLRINKENKYTDEKQENKHYFGQLQ